MGLKGKANTTISAQADILPKRLVFGLLITLISFSFSLRLACAEDQSDPMMKATSIEAGKVTPEDQRLFSDTIRETKASIARDTLDVFYRDALDAYHANRYDEALELLDKIYSIDPYYEDVRSLRETITRLKSNHDMDGKRGILEDYMKKGNSASTNGQNVAAVGYWKQALTVNPSYEPAKKKIQQVNHDLAQKQYEAGYLYYHHGDMEDALDSWSNAIALDQTFKQRGLLLLMSKVELSVRRDKAMRLSTQGYQQFAQKDLHGALQSYEELLKMDPRNEEARRMASKIKIQLGQAAFKSGRDALAQHLYAQAIKQFELSARLWI